MQKVNTLRNLEHNVTRNLSSMMSVLSASPLVNMIFLLPKPLENIFKVLSDRNERHVKVLPLDFEQVILPNKCFETFVLWPKILLMHFLGDTLLTSYDT